MDKRALYIGVTGFATRKQVVEALGYFRPTRERFLMVGVLVSRKSLEGHTTNHPKQFPRVGELPHIFLADDRALNIVHYWADDGRTLKEDLSRIKALGGSNLHGFQVNLPWPDPTALQNLDVRRVVLQIGAKAMEQAKDDVQEAVRRLSRYRGLVTDVLFDMSGGFGIPLDHWRINQFHQAFRKSEMSRYMALGIAGGLSPEQPEIIRWLVPKVSIDVQGRVRVKETDDLDMVAVRQYLDIACKA